MSQGQRAPSRRATRLPVSMVERWSRPPGHEQHAGRRQLLPRVGEVLDHVPHGEHVVAVGRVGPDLERLAVDGEALGAGQPGRPAGELEPLGAEAALPGHLEEVAAVGAHVEEAAAAGRPQRPDHVAEGEDAVVPLGHVERVDDPAVGLLQRLVRRAWATGRAGRSRRSRRWAGGAGGRSWCSARRRRRAGPSRRGPGSGATGARRRRGCSGRARAGGRGPAPGRWRWIPSRGATS